MDKAGVDGYWKLTSSGGLTGGNCTVKVTGTNFSGVADYTGLRMLVRTGSSWTIPGTSLATTGTNTAPVLGRSGLSGGSAEFGIGGFSVDNPLPVTWLDFSALRTSNNNVKTNWSTASEQNTLYFEIERSLDALNWSVIGKVEATGNAQIVSKYSFTDPAPPLSTIYYRIRQKDRNATSSWSEVRSVPASLRIVALYPNPVTHLLSVEGIAEKGTTLVITDMQGVTVAEGKGPKIDVSYLPQGIYVALISDADDRHAIRFLKK
jgi:hypothetical protein